MARSAEKPKGQSFNQGIKSSTARSATCGVSRLTSQSVKGRSALSAAKASAAVRCSQFMVGAKDLQPVVFEGIGSRPVQIPAEHVMENTHPMEGTMASEEESYAKFPIADTQKHFVESSVQHPTTTAIIAIDGKGDDTASGVQNARSTSMLGADKSAQDINLKHIVGHPDSDASAQTNAVSLGDVSSLSAHTISAHPTASSQVVPRTINAQAAASLTRSLFSDEEKACPAQLVQTAGGVGTGKVAYMSRLPSWQISGTVDSSKVRIVEGLNAKSSQLNLASKVTSAHKKSSAGAAHVSKKSYAYKSDAAYQASTEHVIYNSSVKVFDRNLQDRDAQDRSKQDGTHLDRGMSRPVGVPASAPTQCQRAPQALSNSDASDAASLDRHNLSSASLEATGVGAAFDHCSISNQGELTLSKRMEVQNNKLSYQDDTALMFPQQSQVVYCPVEMSLSLLGGKYKALILWKLLECGTLRFLQLRRLIPKATAKILTQQLRELEEHGLVRRTVYPVVPPKVEYSLTDLGITIQPLLEAMYDWGSRYLLHLGHPINCSMSLLHPELPKIDAKVQLESNGSAESMHLENNSSAEINSYSLVGNANLDLSESKAHVNHREFEQTSNVEALSGGIHKMQDALRQHNSGISQKESLQNNLGNIQKETLAQNSGVAQEERIQHHLAKITYPATDAPLSAVQHPTYSRAIGSEANFQGRIEEDCSHRQHSVNEQPKSSNGVQDIITHKTTGIKVPHAHATCPLSGA